MEALKVASSVSAPHSNAHANKRAKLHTGKVLPNPVFVASIEWSGHRNSMEGVAQPLQEGDASASSAVGTSSVATPVTTSETKSSEAIDGGFRSKDAAWMVWYGR